MREDGIPEPTVNVFMLENDNTTPVQAGQARGFDNKAEEAGPSKEQWLTSPSPGQHQPLNKNETNLNKEQKEEEKSVVDFGKYRKMRNVGVPLQAIL